LSNRAQDKWRVFSEGASAKARDMRDRTKLRFQTLLSDTLAILLSPWKFFKVFCFSIGLCVLCGGAALTWYVHKFFQAIPNVGALTADDLQRKGEAVVNRRLETKGKRYKWVKMKDISRELVFSIVISEDATFFEHGGFNLEAMIDSIAENIKERRPAYGASTITQQVAKNLFLTGEKTILRKVQEAILTNALEAKFSKNDLLEIYLNIAEFGPDIFGVNAASHHFFKQTPADINAAQGAFLAQMLPSPRRHYFQIFENKNLTRAKRKRIDRILRDMLYQEYITEKQYRDYVRYRYFDEVTPRSLARSRRGSVGE
jgi:monofunctional glycosyltransferase